MNRDFSVQVTQAMMHHEEAVARKNRCESEAQDAALAVFEAKEIAKEKEVFLPSAVCQFIV